MIWKEMRLLNRSLCTIMLFCVRRQADNRAAGKGFRIGDLIELVHLCSREVE